MTQTNCYQCGETLFVTETNIYGTPLTIEKVSSLIEYDPVSDRHVKTCKHCGAKHAVMRLSSLADGNGSWVIEKVIN